jgi:hypothetical protein
MKDINNRLITGSKYFPEIGHNGNGNIEVNLPSYAHASYLYTKQDAASNDPRALCTEIGELNEPNQVVITPLEFVKPLGSGTNQWPSSPATYNWTARCTDLDALYHSGRYQQI